MTNEMTETEELVNRMVDYFKELHKYRRRETYDLNHTTRTKEFIDFMFDYKSSCMMLLGESRENITKYNENHQVLCKKFDLLKVFDDDILMMDTIYKQINNVLDKQEPSKYYCKVLGLLTDGIPSNKNFFNCYCHSFQKRDEWLNMAIHEGHPIPDREAYQSLTDDFIQGVIFAYYDTFFEAYLSLDIYL